MEQCNEADVILDQRDTYYLRVQRSKEDQRNFIYFNYLCNEANKTRQTFLKIYYECNEASKTRETLYILITY